MSKKKDESLPTKVQVSEFDMLYPMVGSVLSEVRELSKKKQDMPLNGFKAKTINKLLERVKVLLVNEPTALFLDLLDDETLPTNSDAVLVIVQYKSAMEQFKKKYSAKPDTHFDYWSDPEWNTSD